LLIGKVLDDDGFGTVEQVLQGIEWAAGRGARIISMSLEIERQVDQQPSAAFEAIASRLLAETPGILLVAATGNASQRPHYIAPVFDPAACKSILGVAAFDAQRKIYHGSCGQRDALAEVNCCAPGVDVRSAWPGKGYRSASGTSMATAHVSGLAALWLERNPGWTALELWRAIETACVAPNSPASDFGRGLAQAP
jgi:subtilisin family serine protease